MLYCTTINNFCVIINYYSMNVSIFILGGLVTVIVLMLSASSKENEVEIAKDSDCKKTLSPFYAKYLGQEFFYDAKTGKLVDEHKIPLPDLNNYVCTGIVSTNKYWNVYIPCKIREIYPAEDKFENTVIFIVPRNVYNQSFKVVSIQNEKMLVASPTYGKIYLNIKDVDIYNVGDEVIMSGYATGFANLYHIWKYRWEIESC